MREDRERALRVADLAKKSGFNHWLDVLDPRLQAVTRIAGALSPSEHAIAIASILEVGLLRCTHLVVVLSAAALKSRWVPYQYGRVHDRGVLTDEVACWLPSALVRKAPECVQLGAVNPTEGELEAWLRQMHREWRKRRGVHSGSR